MEVAGSMAATSRLGRSPCRPVMALELLVRGEPIRAE